MAKKFPKCEEYGLLFQGVGNGDWIYVGYGCRLDLEDMEKIEQALLRAENKTPHRYNSASYNKGFEQGKLAGKKELKRSDGIR
jgi:hypothetical protein